MAEVFANSEDPDQMPRSVASDPSMHCLPNTLLRVSQLQWVKWLIQTHFRVPSKFADRSK